MGPFIMFRDLTVQLEAFGVFASPLPPPPSSYSDAARFPRFFLFFWMEMEAAEVNHLLDLK